MEQHYLNFDTDTAHHLIIDDIKQKKFMTKFTGSPDIFPGDFLIKYTRLINENILDPPTFKNTIAIDKEALCYYNGSFGHCQRRANTDN